jgi:hypothetical protein
MQSLDDSFETAKRKRIETKVRERCQEWIDTTDLSFALATSVIHDVIIDEKIGNLLIKKNVDSLVAPTCAEQVVNTLIWFAGGHIPRYDFEVNEAEPNEPPSNRLDLWWHENIEVNKVAHTPAANFYSSITKSLSFNQISVKNSTRSIRSKGKSNQDPPSPSKYEGSHKSYIPRTSVEQHPLKDLPPNNDIEEDNASLRKIVARKKNIEDLLCQNRYVAMMGGRYRIVKRKVNKVLSNLAINSKGHIMKRQRVDLDNLAPKMITEPEIKLHRVKLIKNQNINKEGYEKMLNDPSNFNY